MSDITIIVRAQDIATATLAKVDSAQQRLATTGARMTQSYAMAAPAIATAAFAMNKFTAVALEDEKSQARLASAVAANIEEVEKYLPLLEQAAEASMKLGFADETSRNALSTLIVAYGDAQQALALYSLAMDVARGTGMGLEQVTRLLSRVTEETINVFSRYGVKLDDTMSAQEAMTEIQRRFAGQAQAYAESNVGAAEAASLAWGELQEQMGAKVAPVLLKVLQIFSQLPPEVQLGVVAFLAFGPAVASVIPALVGLGGAMITFVAASGPLGLLMAGLAGAAALAVFLADKIAGINLLPSFDTGGVTSAGLEAQLLEHDAEISRLQNLRDNYGSLTGNSRRLYGSQMSNSLERLGELEAGRPDLLEQIEKARKREELLDKLQNSDLPEFDFSAFNWPSFNSGAAEAAEKVRTLEDAMEDMVITYAEALEFNLTPAMAGALEAEMALANAQYEAEESAFNLEKTITKVAVAFSRSVDAGEQMVRALARETMEKMRAANAAIFGGPTREQAILEYNLAQLDKQEADMKAALARTGNLDDFVGFDNQRANLQAQLDAEMARQRLLQADLTLADQTLLTAREQTLAAGELTGAQRELTTWVRQSVTDFRDLHPEIANFRNGLRDFWAIVSGSGAAGGSSELVLMRP